MSAPSTKQIKGPYLIQMRVKDSEQAWRWRDWSQYVEESLARTKLDGLNAKHRGQYRLLKLLSPSEPIP